MNTVVITITTEINIPINNHVYNYSSEDRILRNIISGEYEIFYSG